jgi:hypothetical protein
MGLFGNSKIQGTELQECLSYYNTQLRIGAFQTKEADLYNETMVKYVESAETSRVAAREVSKAANRLSQAAIEILRRHEKMGCPPNSAQAVHFAFYAAYSAYASWASATSAAMEAIVNGMTPNRMYIQQLLEEFNRLWRRANDAEKKFLKRLKLDAYELQRMISKASAEALDDSWRPS